jgi:inner membrane protein involved in colicin E2 resistance
MKILPANIEEQIDRVDRNRSLIIGIGSGVLALWCLYRVLWSLYLMMTYDFLFGSLLFGVVLWGVVGAVAAIAAFGFLIRYSRRP